MRVLTVADLHQRRSLFTQLEEAVALHKPDVVALVGDFLDGWVPPPAGVDLISAEDAALTLADLPCEVVMVRGNHETEDNWPDFEAAWMTTGRPLHALHGSSVNIGGLEIVGFPCWTGNDGAYAKTRTLGDYRSDAWLDGLIERFGAAARGLWLLHEPPTRELAGEWAYCAEWERAVRTFEPLVAVSGHDHNEPFRAERWWTTVSKTVAINLGQRVYPQPGRLLYATVDFRFDADGTPRLLEGGIKRHGV